MALQGLLAQPMPGESSSAPASSKGGLKGILATPIPSAPPAEVQSAVKTMVSKTPPAPTGDLSLPATSAIGIQKGQTIQNAFPDLNNPSNFSGTTPSTTSTNVMQNLGTTLMSVPKTVTDIVKGIFTQETKPNADTQEIEKNMPGGSELLGNSEQSGIVGATVQDLSIPAKVMTRFFAPIVQGAGQNIADAIIANNKSAQENFGPTDQNIVNAGGGTTKVTGTSLLPSANQSILQGVGNFMQLAFAAATPEIGGSLGLGGASETTGMDILRTLGTQSAKDAFVPLAKVVGQAAVDSGIHGAEAGIWFGTAQALSNGETDPGQIGSTVFKSALGLGLLGSIVGAGSMTSEIAKTALTKDIIAKYDLPSTVFVSADKINEYVNTGKLTDADAKALFEQIGGLGEMQKQAKEQGTNINELRNTGAFFKIPLTDILQVSDKPYFAKIKEAFGLQPDSEGHVIQGGVPTLGMNKQLPAAGETTVKDDAITAALKSDIADNLERNHAPKNIAAEVQKETGSSEAHANDIVSQVAKEKGIETPELEKPTAEEILQKVSESVKEKSTATEKPDAVNALGELSENPEVQADWEQNHQDDYTDLGNQLHTLEEKLKVAKGDEKVSLKDQTTIISAKMAKIEGDFIKKYQVNGKVISSEGFSLKNDIEKQRQNKELQDELAKQFSDEKPAENPYKNETDIKKLESSLRDEYGKHENISDTLGQIGVEMDLSEAGKRTIIGTGADREVLATHSTFPKWIPEDLRSKALFNKVFSGLDDVSKLSMPDDGKTRQRALYDAILDELDSRLGTDTKALRSRIIEIYDEKRNKTETSKANNRGVAGGEKGRGKEAGEVKNTVENEGIEKILKNKEGEIKLSNKELGDVNLIYGRPTVGKVKGYGLAKIESDHPDVFPKLVEEFANAEITEKLPDRTILQSETMRFIVDHQLGSEKKDFLNNAYYLYVPRAGIEPAASSFSETRSTTELPGHKENIAKTGEEVKKRAARTVDNQDVEKTLEKFEGFKDITVGVLKKLEGRTSVSKQFISDMTNGGNLKQAERDLIRGILAEYPDGKNIPVKDFAEKVKAEILPLGRQTIPEDFQKYERVSLEQKERGKVKEYGEHIYTSPIKNTTGQIHFADAMSGNDYFAHTRTEDLPDNTTRRVLEVQSDLFQKGRIENEKENKLMESEVMQRRKEAGLPAPEGMQEIPKEVIEKEFARLEPYKNTWQDRIVSEELRAAAQDGKSEVLFPTGETAMKIEKLGSSNTVWVAIKNGKRVGEALEISDLKIGKEINQIGQEEIWVITDVLGAGKFKAIPKDIYDKFQKGEVHLNSEESFDIGKIDVNNPIYKFYQRELGKFLTNRYDATEITDKQGVSWYKVDVRPAMATEPVVAFSSIPEKAPREPKPKVEKEPESKKPALDPKEMINMAKEIEKMKPVGGFRQALREVATLFNPVGQADSAAVDVLMKRKGEYERALFRTEQTMKSIKNMWDKQPEEARLDFMDKVETGRIGEISSQFRELATIYRDRLDNAHKQISQFKNINFLQNFFPHFWKDPKQVEKVNLYAKLNARRPLQGSKPFTKERVFDTIKQGVDLGYELETSNPEELMQTYEQNVQKFAMANEIKTDMLARGFWKTVVAGQHAPDGFTRIDDAISKVYLNPNIPILEAYDEIATNKLNAIIDNLGIKNERKYNLGRGKAGVMGFTQEGSDSITTKFSSPLSVTAHELGHQIDFKYGLQDMFVDPNLPTITRELRALADLRYEGHNVTAGYKAYVRSGPEKMAVMTEALIHAPEKFKEVAPFVYDKFTDFLSRHAELKPLLDVKPSLVMGVREDSVYAGGMVLGAEHYAQADVARLVNNYLSKDRIMDTAIGKGIMNVKNTMNAFELGFSAFHITMETLDTVISKFAIGLGKISQGNLGGLKDMFASTVAPVTYFNAGRKFYNGDPDLAAIEKDIFSGGASLRDKQYYKNGVFDAFMKRNREIAGDIQRGEVWTGVKKAAVQVLRVPMTAIEATMRPIFTYYIPRLKVGAFRDLFAAELERNSQKIQDKRITREEVARNVWNNVENRMGELNYDNLFWNRNLKTALMLTTRAVGWNLGTIRELGGGIFQDLPKSFGATKESREDFSKYGFDFTPKMGYTLSLFFMVAMISTIYQLLHTGQGPSSVKDLFYPRNGATAANGEPYRVEFPTYLKDIYQSGIPQLLTGQPFAAADSAVSMLKNKSAPELATIIDLMDNSDFYGNMIRNPNDNAPTQLKQVTLYLLSQFEPFTIQQQQNLSSGKSTAEQQAEAFLGIIKAPADIISSDYDKQLQAIYTNQSGSHAPETPEQQAAQNKKAAVVDQIKKGDYSGIQGLVNEGIIKPTGIKQFIEDALLTTPQKEYKGLSPSNKAKLQP